MDKRWGPSKGPMYNYFLEHCDWGERIILCDDSEKCLWGARLAAEQNKKQLLHKGVHVSQKTSYFSEFIEDYDLNVARFGDNLNQTPLMVAMEKCWEKDVRALVTRGANVIAFVPNFWQRNVGKISLISLCVSALLSGGFVYTVVNSDIDIGSVAEICLLVFAGIAFLGAAGFGITWKVPYFWQRNVGKLSLFSFIMSVLSGGGFVYAVADTDIAIGSMVKVCLFVFVGITFLVAVGFGITWKIPDFWERNVGKLALISCSVSCLLSGGLTFTIANTKVTIGSVVEVCLFVLIGLTFLAAVGFGIVWKTSNYSFSENQPVRVIKVIPTNIKQNHGVSTKIYNNKKISFPHRRNQNKKTFSQFINIEQTSLLGHDRQSDSK